MSAATDRSMVRFAIVGLANYVVSTVTFWLCFHYLPRIDVGALAGLDVLRVREPAGAIANVIAYVAGMANSFALNRSWTFGAGGRVGRQALRFTIVNLASLAASTVVVYRFVDVADYPELAVWAPMTFVVMVVNYLGCRYWAFAPDPADVRGEPARLIVHADDFGLSEAVNRAVIDAHARGILTSTSIIVAGDAFEHAVRLAHAHPTLDVGVHLTLTGERPVGVHGADTGLVDRDGRLPPNVYAFALRYLRGGISRDALRAELAAQIETALARGLAVTHLDGHQHVHALPGIAAIVAELAQRYGIRAIRYPRERFRGWMLRDLRRLPRVLGQLALGAAAALSPLRAHARVDAFAGFYFGGRLTEANLLTQLAALPARATTELMCHPGHDDPDSRYRHWNYAWPAELAALTSARVRAFVAARGVRLVSYRDV